MKDRERISHGIHGRSASMPKSEALIEPDGRAVLFIHVHRYRVEYLDRELRKSSPRASAPPVRVYEQHFNLRIRDADEGDDPAAAVPQTMDRPEVCQFSPDQRHQHLEIRFREE